MGIGAERNCIYIYIYILMLSFVKLLHHEDAVLISMTIASRTSSPLLRRIPYI